MKRDAKKKRDPTAKRKKPISVIPSNVPFKEAIIQEAKELKEKEIERKRLLKCLLSGQIKMDAIVKEKPVFKLNSKKKQIKIKKSVTSLSTVTLLTNKSNNEAMQCD